VITGGAPLHWSSRYGHLEVSRVLLDHGADMNAREYNYWFPMHLSTANGYLEIVKLLLERGADMHAMDGEGDTKYRCEDERLQIYYGRMVGADSEKGSTSTSSFCDLNALSDWCFDFSP
jgi:ankyrin repeat protein